MNELISLKILFKDFIYLFLERGEGRERERKRNINAWLPLEYPLQGPGLQPRHVPWLGIQLATLWSASLHSIHWATPARANVLFLIQVSNPVYHTVIPPRSSMTIFSDSLSSFPCHSWCWYFGMSLSLGLSDAFSWLDQSCRLWGKNIVRVVCPSHQSLSVDTHDINMSNYRYCYLDYLVKVMSTRFLYYKARIFFFYTPFEGSYQVHPLSREENLAPPPRGRSIKEFNSKFSNS